MKYLFLLTVSPTFIFQTSSFNPFRQINPTGGVGNLFGSQAATAIRDKKVKTDTQGAIDDALYELPDNPNLELGDGLLQTLGTNAEDLFQADNITKKEEEDVILEQIKNEYGFEDIKDTIDEGNVPENIYFFYGGESDNLYKALEFVGLSPMNREFGAFLMSDLGGQVMNDNRLLIHVESGDIFYENHNTGDNFYNFLLAQQNDDAAFIPKKLFLSQKFLKLY